MSEESRVANNGSARSRVVPAGTTFLAIGIVFLLQQLGFPYVGSTLFIALGLGFAASYVFPVDRRRYTFLILACGFISMGLGLLIAELISANAALASFIFLASLAIGLLAIFALAPYHRWPLVPAAVVFALALVSWLGQATLIPEPLRPFLVPVIILAVGVYLLLAPGI